MKSLQKNIESGKKNLLLEQFDEKILEKVRGKVKTEIMPQICSSMTECISVLEIEQEIKDKVVKALGKESIKDESNLSNKIVKIIKDVMKSLFEK